jgi:fucose permease
VVPTANFCALSRHGANAGAASAFLGFCNMGIGGAASSLLTGLVQQHFGNQMFGVVMLVLALLSMATVIAVDRDDSAAS